MTIGTPAGRGEELREGYRRLSRPPINHVITTLMDEGQWLESNLLLDDDLPAEEVARRVGIQPEVITMMRNPRRCLDQHDGDTEALARCLDASKSS